MFIRFPFSRPEICQKWIKAVRRENWKPNKSSDICSEHFISSDYEEPLPGDIRRRLKPDAVPSQFKFPPHLINPIKKGGFWNVISYNQKKK